MARLPELRKITVLAFRRRGPDEILLVPKPSRDTQAWGLPSTIREEGEAPEAAARRLVAEILRGEVLAVLPLGVTNEFTVKNGPSAGNWHETFMGVELAVTARPATGNAWLLHYEAKAQLAAAKAREAITELRAKAKLVP